jgi:hypothetical protein
VLVVRGKVAATDSRNLESRIMRTRGQRWRNVAGKFIIECGLTDAGPVDVQERKLPDALASFLTAHEFDELVIEFRSSGYDDPGQTCGDPDDCYPPEGDDERTVTAITLSGEPVPRELWDAIEDMYADEIAAEEIDWRDAA